MSVTGLLPADDKEKAIKVEAEAIRLWVKSPATMVATVILHLVTVWALWRILSHVKLIIWAVAGIAWCGLRLAVWFYYIQRSWDDPATLRWGRLFAGMLGVTALIVASFSSLRLVSMQIAVLY